MAAMELSAWRDAVSYGPYLQPIHLHVAGSASTHASSSSVRESPSQSTQNARQDDPKTTDALPNRTPVTQELPETSTERPDTPNTAQSTGETTDVTVIPPFTCEDLNNGEQMALNVGGPVWAMDWLPSKPAANAAAVADALAKSKQKKPRRSSGTKKKAQKRSLKGKENNQVEDGETTAASNGSAEPEEGSKLEWRYLALTTHPPCQVEDGKVVKSTPPDHFYDVPESARNLIQIWAVPVQNPKILGTSQLKIGKTVKRKLVKPRMVYAIDHESGVAWDLQWCPLVKKFPKTTQRENVLGILAACFGDGSMRIFEIPKIPEERLQPKLEKDDCLVVKNTPIVVARLPQIMQLSVQWSPHNWHMLLTGGSDGSVSLWNIKSTICENGSLGNESEPLEPQRRFQDADTIGKQEAFDWGCGWVAIRAVAWSPFDDHLFATTGNDSVFKVWDVREPRVCLRSHRIRSTWGLALQWMDQTCIQISGDQGSVYMYDILTGSYQKLHFHPQIDSPVWDLQFARRGALPLLVSSCTSGSIRAAPAKKLYRAPQNCVEICRLSGQNDSSIEKPFKSLTVSFEKHSVLGSADSVSLNTREFCERDAALHRLRLSSSTAGDYPCFLAAGGHAGLVILLEMQEALDTLISTFFSPPSKKIGRPKKIFATIDSNHGSKKVSPKSTGGVPSTAVSAGRKTRTFGSLAPGKLIHTANKKALSNGKSKGAPLTKPRKKAFIQDDGEVEIEESVEEEEPEFEEEDEEEDESDLSLVMEDCSDDDRASVSDNDIEEEETATTNESPEEARLMKEYQLDLSEEDAVLLAIQMSEYDNASPATVAKTGTEALSSTPIPTKLKEQQKKAASTKAKAAAKPKGKTAPKPKNKTAPKSESAPTTGKREKRARSSSTAIDTTAQPNIGAKKISAKQLDHSADTETKVSIVTASPSAENSKTVPTSVAATTKKTQTIQSKKAPARKTTPKTKTKSPILLEAISQAMALQAFEYQMGMSEEDAIKEAIRLSEMEDKCHSLRVKQSTSTEPVSGPTPTQPKQIPTTPRTKGASQKKQKKVKEPKKKDQEGDVIPDEDDSQRQRPQTPRRLEFSPLNSSESGDHVNVPAANITSNAPVVECTTAIASRNQPSLKKPSRKKSPTVVASKTKRDEKKSAAKVSKDAAKTPKKAVEKKQPSSASAAAAPATPEGKKPAKRSRSTGAKAAGPPRKRKKSAMTPRGGRRSANNQDDIMSEEDAILLALKMSEIEY